MGKAIPGLEFLNAPANYPVMPVCAVFGEEAFLKRQVVLALQAAVLAGEDAEFSQAEFNGDGTEWRQVIDELSTVALFGGGQRFVVIHDADDFVSKNRPRLEDYVAEPRRTGILVLVVKTWPSNTKLYKAIDKSGLQIDCKAPEEALIKKWLGNAAKQRLQVTLPLDAADALLDILGPEMGLLDAELNKLALLAEPGPKGPTITAELVTKHVGGWRVQQAWGMIDAAAEGRAKEALDLLDKLLNAGMEPIGLLAQMAAILRRFTVATRIVQRGEADGRRVPVASALASAGVKTWPAAMQKAESQIKQLGRDRAGAILHWLYEADLAVKGSHSSPHRSRQILERLILRMARVPQAR